IERSAPGSIAIRPLDGTRLGPPAGDPSRPSWWLRSRSDTALVPGRTAVVQDDGELEFLIGDRIHGRFGVQRASDGNWRLRRRVVLDATRLLPRAPEARPIAKVVAGEVSIGVEAPAAFTGVDPGLVAVVVERELVYGADAWTQVAESRPGERRVALKGVFERTADDPLDEAAPVARLRVRRRISFGPQSLPTQPVTVLAAGADPGARALALEDATLGLDDPVFQRRVEARAVLRALGDEARPALEAIATGDLGPRGIAARDVLRSIEAGDLTSRGAARRLLRRAVDAARVDPELSRLDDPAIARWVGEVPAGLLMADPAVRTHRLLVLVDRAERGVLREGGPPGDVAEDCRRAALWATAVAASDPDEGVAKLAEFLVEVGPRPSLASFEASSPAYLLPPDRREGRTDLASRTWLELPGSAEELAWQLEGRPELGDLDLGPPLARLLHALRDVGGRASASDRTPQRFFDYDARTVDLVLRLVDRVRRDGDRRALLDAAEALLPGEDRTLAAWREVVDRRLASPTASGIERRVALVDAPDLDALVGVLRRLEVEGDGRPGEDSAGVDVLLPAGVYRGDGGAVADVIEIGRSGIRLRPAEPGSRVELRVGLRLRGVRNVILEGIDVVHGSGSALTLLDGAHAVALGARLAGAGSVLYVQDSDLELVECVVEGADIAKPPQWSFRELGRSRLFARASLFSGGTAFFSEESWNLLDRCVVDAGPRTLVQAQRSGHVAARESLLRGTNLGLYNVTRGVLAAVVIDCQRDPLGRRPSGLRVSPRLFHLVGDEQRVPSSMRMSLEPLRPR
ncbi:MAG: hypothetical protein AAGA20_04185, partial [Planctomycetota bacterium]